MPETDPSYLTPVTRVQRKDAGRAILIAATTTNAVIMLSVVSLIILSTDLSKEYAGLRILATVSLIFQIISAAALLWLSWRERRRRMGFAGMFSNCHTQRIRDVAGAAIIIGVAQALTLGSFIWSRQMIDDPSFEAMEGSIVMTVSVILIVAWVLSVAGEAITLYISFPALMKKQEKTRPRMTINTQLGGQPHVSRPILSSPAQLDSPRSASGSGNGNPFISPNTSPEQPSKTSSMISLPSMITKLPKRLSSLRRSLSQSSLGAPTASPRPSGESAFDTWDTSGVPQEMRSAMVTPPALTGNAQAQPRLPTIPGSRPASPAKPLDGPFPMPDGKLTSRNGSLRLESPPPIIAADTADLPPSPTVMQQIPKSFTPPAGISSTSTLPHSPISSISPAALSPISSISPPLLGAIDSTTSLRAPPPVLPTTASAADRIGRSPSITSFHSTPSYGEATAFKPPPSFAVRPSLESHPSVESFHHLRQIPVNVPEGDAQIHPLFRVGSPEPSPMMSPNTVVTGAPVQLSDVPADIVRASVDRVRNTRTPSIGTPSLSRPPSRPERPESSGRAAASRKSSLVGGAGNAAMFAPPQSPALPNHMFMTPSGTPVTRAGFTPPQTPGIPQMFMAPSVSPVTASGFAPPQVPVPADTPVMSQTFMAHSVSPATAAPSGYAPPQGPLETSVSHHQMYLAHPPPTMNPNGTLSHMFVASSSHMRSPSMQMPGMQMSGFPEMQMPTSPTLASVQMHPGGALSQMFMASTANANAALPFPMLAAHSVSPVLANMFPTPQPSAGLSPPTPAGLPSPSPLHQDMRVDRDSKEIEADEDGDQGGKGREEEMESRRSSRVEDLAELEEGIEGHGRTNTPLRSRASTPGRSRAGTPGEEVIA